MTAKIPDSLPWRHNEESEIVSEGDDAYIGETLEVIDGDYSVHACNAYPALVEALKALVNAKALSGVRDLVAGWNGESRPEGPYNERHPRRLGATLPKTTCGAVCDLDEALVAARAALKAAGVEL